MAQLVVGIRGLHGSGRCADVMMTRPTDRAARLSETCFAVRLVYVARTVSATGEDGGAGGQASVKINGRSAVMASAFSIAQAYVEAVVDADACDKCEATAKLVAEQNEELWLEAVAVAEVYVMSMTYPGMSRSIWIEEFVETVKEGVTSAFAEVLVPPAYAAMPPKCIGDMHELLLRWSCVSGAGQSCVLWWTAVLCCVVGFCGVTFRGVHPAKMIRRMRRMPRSCLPAQLSLLRPVSSDHMRMHAIVTQSSQRVQRPPPLPMPPFTSPRVDVGTSELHCSAWIVRAGMSASAGLIAQWLHAAGSLAYASTLKFSPRLSIATSV